MAYAKKDWISGEVIAEEALDNMENGISANSTAIEQLKQTATQDANGLMSSADKQKLDGLNAYVLPNAAAEVVGGVKQAKKVEEAKAEQVTQEEFKALLDALKNAGIMAK